MPDTTAGIAQSPAAPEAPLTWNILCVDDEESVVKALRRLLRQGPYKVFPALSGVEGLKIMAEQSIDLVISDMRMPEMSGADFLTEVATQHPNCIRILLTGYSDMDSTIKAVNDGQIHRYIQKPWNNEDLLLILEQSLERVRLERENKRLLVQVEAQNKQLQGMNEQLEEKVNQRTEQIRMALAKLEKANLQVRDNLNSTIRTFYNLISLNPHLGGSAAVKTGELCKLFCLKLGVDKAKIREIQLAGLLAELGLLGQPAELLSKPIELMTPEELTRFKSHPISAHVALAPATGLSGVAEIIRHQYEQLDGSGFPDKLTKEQIPLGSKILAVSRDYIYAVEGKLKKTRTSSQGAIELLIMGAGRAYDGELVDLLPALVSRLTSEQALSDNEHIISLEKLVPGMLLTRSLLNQNEIMLLPEGHVFTEETIKRLKAFEETERTPLELYVIDRSKAP